MCRFDIAANSLSKILSFPLLIPTLPDSPLQKSNVLSKPLSPSASSTMRLVENTYKGNGLPRHQCRNRESRLVHGGL